LYRNKGGWVELEKNMAEHNHKLVARMVAKNSHNTKFWIKPPFQKVSKEPHLVAKLVANLFAQSLQTIVQMRTQSYKKKFKQATRKILRCI